MKVVHAYNDFYHLVEQPNNLLLGLCAFSAYAWKRHNCLVEMYCNPESVPFFENLGLYDSIVPVNFEYTEGFWAYPRIQSGFLVTEPCIMSDIDIIPDLDIGSFNEEKPWAIVYQSYINGRDKEVVESFSKKYNKLSLEIWSGGLVYYPDPEEMHTIYHKILEDTGKTTHADLIAKYGLADFLISIEQRIPSTYYEQKGISPEYIEQVSDPEKCRRNGRSVYHAMDMKYLKTDKEKQNLIFRILSRFFAVDRKQALKLLGKANFSQEFLKDMYKPSVERLV